MNATTSHPTENWAGATGTTDTTASTPDTPDSLADSLATAELATADEPATTNKSPTTTETATTTEAAPTTADPTATTAEATTTEPTTAEAATTRTTTPDMSSGSVPTEEVSIPTEEVSIPTHLPDPETTIYRDSTTVIRLLQTETMHDEVEVRLYRSDDSAVDHIEPESNVATDGGRGDSSVAALPEATRQRFKTAVDAAAERFDFSRQAAGRCRERRPHGANGVLEFSVTLDA